MFKKYLSIVINPIQRALRKEDGLTLIEAAIGLVIIGLIAVPLMHSYKLDLINDSRSKTRGSLTNIENAINQYHAAGNFAYPCPASVSLQEGDSDFGLSGDCTLANIKLCTHVLWSTTEGICKTSDTTNAAIIGAVPFSTLKMQQEKALDFWGNKFIYAVTLEQTDNATFTTNSGTIRVNAVDSPTAIQDRIDNGTPLQSSNDGIPGEKTSTVDFFLFSTGALGIGGYTKDGVPIQACGNAATGFEHENCDFDDIFFYDVNPANTEASAYSEVAGTNFFDDITRAQLSLSEAIWFPHPDHNQYLLTMSTRIGIGTSEPDASIEVVGNIQTNKMLKSDQMCDSTGSDCFDPELITGNMDVMKCDPIGDSMIEHQAVMELSGSQVHCSSTVYGETYANGSSIPSGLQGNAIDGKTLRVDTSIISGSTISGSSGGRCPTGRMVSGIDASGEIKCIIPTP